MFSEENNKIKVILASASPRRSLILSLLKIKFDVIVPFDCHEKVFQDPYATVTENSIKKSKNVADYVKINEIKILAKDYKDIFICGFDTIVYFKNKYYFKPKDFTEAKKFLSFFSGKTHSVITGVCVLNYKTNVIKTDFDETRVTLRKLSKEDIDNFLANEHVLDKAGAYNIEGYGASLVRKINGCFFNVVGLPVYKFLNILKEYGYNLNNFNSIK
ncbi:MAG: Maf family protein [Actinomycetota bacterium]|nr:Maf family protein [Actinomycetota bacterium]